MKKWEKEILQKQIADEASVSLKLESYYKEALKEVNNKIQVLMSKEQTQSVIYQLKYQQELEKQLSEIYGKMSSHYYTTADDYLTNCYEDSFYTTMYGIHQEGIPVVMPFDQKEAWQMAAQSEYSGIKLSEKLYVNNSGVAQKVRQEITKGIAMNSSYADITRRVAAKSEASINQAYRIVRTEGHRIQNEVKFKTINKVKDESGADIVKQWDATIDKRTRPDHVALDGQLREVDQPFKTPSGKTAMFPGGFGIAKEDINCRCVCLQRARWALDKSELDKVVGDLDGATEEQLEAWAKKLGVSKADLIKSSNGIIEKDGSINHAIKAQNYNQFKKKYQTKAATKTKQLESQLDLAQKQKADLLNGMTEEELKKAAENDLLFGTNTTNFDKFQELQKQNAKIADLQKKLGIEPQKATKVVESELSKVTSAADFDDMKKNSKWFDNMYEADDYYTKNVFEPRRNDYTPNELKAAKNYTGETHWDYKSGTGTPSYYQMNKALREESLNEAVKSVQNDVKWLTDAMEKSPLPEDVRIRRGLRGGVSQFANTMFENPPDLALFSDKSFQDSLIGSRVRDLGFMSCGVAEGTGFSGFNLEIYMPKGSKAMYLEPISHFKGGSEKELLLQQGSYFEIKEIQTDSRGYITNVILQLIEQKPTKL